jgi:hypothetical protein
MCVQASTLISEILVPRVLWRFENREKVENSENHWNALLISNPLPTFLILILDIHGISYGQSGSETKRFILVNRYWRKDVRLQLHWDVFVCEPEALHVFSRADGGNEGCTLEEHRKVEA